MRIISKPNDLIWTKHCLAKLRQYGLTTSRMMRVLRHPDRSEAGVVENTVAIMQKAGSAKHPYEIWVMYSEDSKGKVKILSAWKYPGISPIHEPPPVPRDEMAISK